MSKGLYQQNPIFKHYFDICCREIENLKGTSLKSIMFAQDDSTKKLLSRC
jgi:acyl transferase domain-containing protein